MSHAGEAMSEMTLEQVIPFLLGEEEMEEVYFGERPLNMGSYWWREHLRDAWKAHIVASKAKTVDVEEIREVARQARAMSFIGWADKLADALPKDQL